ncbi:MAG: hypothetical protein V2I33_14570, partial [Kangiellaceae bacterium]|nr:hypothetical protein [Kangiellaceae bacterium]
VSAEHIQNVQIFKRIYSTYYRNKDLISIGAYEPGSDREIDEAIALMPAMKVFLQQAVDESRHFAESTAGMEAILQSAHAQNSPSTYDIDGVE